VFPLHRPLEEAFDNGYLSIAWRGTKGGARAEGDYCMHWLGRDDLLLHDFSKFPWKTNTKLSTEQQTQLRGYVLCLAVCFCSGSSRRDRCHLP
jgi:hypothetical protein